LAVIGHVSGLGACEGGNLVRGYSNAPNLRNQA